MRHPIILLLTALLFPIASAAQTDFRGTASLGTGGGGPAFVREVDAIFMNPANLAAQERGDRVIVTFGRVADQVGGDLLQVKFYNDYLTGGDVLSDQDISLMLDDWFGSGMRSVRNGGDALLAAFTVHGENRGYGGALRLRSYVQGQLNRGVFDFVLGGMDENRTIPLNAAVRSFSTLDLSVGTGFYTSPRLRIGIAPKFVMGLGYTKGEFTSDLTIDDYTLTHEFDYEFQTAGADAYLAGEMSPFTDENGTELTLGSAGLGAGIDLGATYELTDRLDIAASITDLGVVRWSKNAKTVTPAGSAFQLEELTVGQDQLDEEYDGEVGEYITDVVDSLADASYGQVNTEEGGFMTRLPTALHVGGTWTRGFATFTGGISTGLSKAGGFVRMPTAYLGTELRLGTRSFHLPLRTGIRIGGKRALGIGAGVGIHTPIYDLDIGASVTPYSTLMGRGAQVAVSTAVFTIRI